MRYLSTTMGGTVTLGAANTFSTATSLQLTAGTWMINGQLLIGRNTATTTIFYARLHDGTNELSHGQEITAANTSSYTTINLITIKQYGNTSTVNLDGACSIVSSFMRARTFANGATSTATQITAFQIGT
jgi:hypothetical protein